MPKWKMKMDPARYLSRHPHGPGADLARSSLDAKLKDYRETLEQVSSLIAHCASVLIGYLGCDFHDEDKSEGGPDSVPAVCRNRFIHWPPKRDLSSYGWQEYGQAENKLCGKMVRKFGVRLDLHGTLGAPLDVWNLPKY